MRFRILAIVFLMLITFFSGCAIRPVLRGSYSTESSIEAFNITKIIVIQPDILSLRERLIRELIAQKFSELGFEVVDNLDEAKYAALFMYSFGQGEVNITSNQYGVRSSTSYPRIFQLFVVDLEQSKYPDKLKIIWQGEVYSEGSSTDITRLAPHFVNVLFTNYGMNISNKHFRIVMF